MGSYRVCKSAPVRKLEAELSSLAHRPACARSRSSIEEISELFCKQCDHRQFSFAHVKRLSTVIKFFKHLNNEGLDSEQHKLSGLPID
ncbi:hypothetical protein CFRS1_v007218 [Colletotrichum fructicola]|nr:hypothetical protein CFRS1_v007218 [Colletotrichum fructicola]